MLEEYALSFATRSDDRRELANGNGQIHPPQDGLPTELFLNIDQLDHGLHLVTRDA
jgi:hypothetical protein